MKNKITIKPLLRFPGSQIRPLASRYQYTFGDRKIIGLAKKIKSRQYLNKSELEKIAYWKAPRSAGHVLKNEENYIKEITGFAFKSKDERSRIESLTLLDGVSWPTASVILHFFHQAPYPILDYRALWSVGLEVPNIYSFDFWWIYAEFCRKTAHAHGVKMRTLDRALWQFSKENQ
jgi:hypothetical protein